MVFVYEAGQPVFRYPGRFSTGGLYRMANQPAARAVIRIGFSVRTANTSWDPAGRIGEYGWGGAASTHYWTSPKDKLVVVTMEQTMPYDFLLEFALKGVIYDAIIK